MSPHTIRRVLLMLGIVEAVVLLAALLAWLLH